MYWTCVVEVRILHLSCLRKLAPMARDNQGSTILHAAAARGQVEAVKDLVASFDIINSMDHQGNSALHIAAYRGQQSVVEALIVASPSMISSTNNAGETFASYGCVRTPNSCNKMYYTMSGHVEKLVKEIKKGAASVEGVTAKLWQLNNVPMAIVYLNKKDGSFEEVCYFE